MTGHLLTDPRSRSRYDVKYSWWETCLESKFAKADGAKRREAGGLEDNSISAGERRPEFPGGDYHREVPRDNQPDHAERLPQREIQSGLGDIDRFAEELVGGTGIVPQRVGDVIRLPARVADGLSYIASLELRQFLSVSPYQIRKSKKDVGPADRGPARPFGKGLLR